MDFAGNRTCTTRRVAVDNTPPTVAFTDQQRPGDPELVSAPTSDATSGIATGRIYYRAVGADAWQPLATRFQTGALRARVDSTAVPAGSYEFRAVAFDRAGNVAATTVREDAQPMVLSFPLKSGVRLVADLGPGHVHHQTIAYRRRGKVSGRLLDRGGHPLADQPVTVVEHFRPGALIQRRVRTVSTDRHGLWGERIPAGPSRRITALYDGNRRYLAATAPAGRLQVRTKATLHLSRPRVHAGGHVAFRGRIKHYAARIPDGGKLLELQVKAGRAWDTVRHPIYTNARGHYRLRYHFQRFYTRNVRYRFRVKVLRERGWAYKAAKTRSRKLLVKAR